MSIKDWFEDGLDSLIGKQGRKIVEQVGHFAIWPGGVGGVPGAALVMGLDFIPGLTMPIWVHVIGGVLTAGALAAWREYNQNIGDPIDESTIEVIHFGDRKLPINKDMIIDWIVSTAGGSIAGVGFFFI